MRILIAIVSAAILGPLILYAIHRFLRATSLRRQGLKDWHYGETP